MVDIALELDPPPKGMNDGIFSSYSSIFCYLEAVGVSAQTLI